jgi:hypothetical protein
MNNLNENDYKNILQRDEKAREKHRDINNILTMITHTGTDILRQFVSGEMTDEQTTDIITNLIAYTNDTLKIISHRYSCVVTQINAVTFDISRLRV